MHNTDALTEQLDCFDDLMDQNGLFGLQRWCIHCTDCSVYICVRACACKDTQNKNFTLLGHNGQPYVSLKS